MKRQHQQQKKTNQNSWEFEKKDDLYVNHANHSQFTQILFFHHIVHKVHSYLVVIKNE